MRMCLWTCIDDVTWWTLPEHVRISPLSTAGCHLEWITCQREIVATWSFSWRNLRTCMCDINVLYIYDVDVIDVLVFLHASQDPISVAYLLDTLCVLCMLMFTISYFYLWYHTNEWRQQKCAVVSTQWLWVQYDSTLTPTLFLAKGCSKFLKIDYHHKRYACFYIKRISSKA